MLDVRSLSSQSLSAPSARLIERAIANDALWYPLLGPQLAAYLCLADELFYGGAAGGGKTDLALGLAFTAHKRTLILRRESTQLRGIIERSIEIIGDRGRLNEVMGRWRMYDGRVIELSGCKLEADKRKFQGRPHDLLVFDEAPEFLESQVVFISGWARTEDPEQRVRILLTGNPPTTAEGRWIIERYAAWLDAAHPNPAQPGELRWYAMVDGEEIERADGQPFEHGDETIQPRSRTFIPARVTDNPFYMATGYESQLQALPEPLRAQMLYGDFAAGVDDDPWQAIPTEWIKTAQGRWTEDAPDIPLTALGCDPARGGKDCTAIAKRYGTWFSYKKWPGSLTRDGPVVAALVISAMDADARPDVNVDIIGVGGSVFDSLAAQDIEPLHGVNFAEATTKTDRSGRFQMRNVRAAAWWAMRESLDPKHGHNIALPPDGELLADLTAPKWKLTVSGIQIESKDDIKKRLGRSPDVGDAVVLANYIDGSWLFDF